MPASTTSSLSSRSSGKNSSGSSNGSRRSSGSRDTKLLLRAESDFAETASVASSTSSWTTSSLSSHSGKLLGGVSASLATSCASLRDLELRKSQIELELRQVQHELQLRESQSAAAAKSNNREMRGC